MPRPSNKVYVIGHVVFVPHPLITGLWVKTDLSVAKVACPWLVSFDFIARLAETMRDTVPDDYKRLRAFLSVAQPETMKNLTKAGI